MEAEFRVAVEAGRKFVPVICTCVLAEPTMNDEGVTEVRVGIRLSTVNEAADEVPPPGIGFKTVTV